MSNEYDEVVGELMSVAKEPYEGRPPRRKAVTVWAKVLVLGAVLITLASGVLAAVVLFNQTPTYTSVAMMWNGCAAGIEPTGAASGNLIHFTCPTHPAINVISSASGFVTYTAFTVPSNVTDVYLIDTLAKANTTCPSWTSPGDWNLPLQLAGGQITIGTVAGRIQPGHGYDYCVDYLTAPPSFFFSITWGQG
ncbi:MAG TPA: hypothetical protein VEY12_03525 [Thermoplasmata archaeon]|nr:hypothetical protein [Thermoplasmata archaeon]